MKKLLSIFIIFILLLSCKNKVINNTYVPTYSSKQIKDRINKYYNLDLKDSLIAFIDEWNKNIVPVSENYANQNDTIKNIYTLFADLYRPLKFGDIKISNYFKNKIKYIVIQNVINYDVVCWEEFNYLRKMANTEPTNKNYFLYKTKRMLNFRPEVNIDTIKHLYLTKEYSIGFNEFLGSKYLPIDSGNIANDTISEEETNRRQNFICSLIPVVQGYWGGYWHIETFPIVKKIIFDNKFKHALVDFRRSVSNTICGYSLQKVRGHWVPDKYETLMTIQE
jgi:hypothetical protein